MQARARRLSFRKRIAFIAISNILALGLLAVVGEITCRLFAPQATHGTWPNWLLKMRRFSDDRYLGWELRPGVLDHNSAGMRGREITVQKPPGVWRIAMIGDSVTYGLGVEAAQAFPSLLESELNAAGAGAVEVLNCGVPGYNPFQEYTLLKRRLLEWDPDLVVMTFTPDDVETAPVVLNVGGNMCLFPNRFQGSRLLDNSIHWALFRRSYLYRFLYQRAILALAAPEGRFAVGSLQPELRWADVRRTADICADRHAQFLLVLSPWLLPYCRPPEGMHPGLPDPEEFRRYEQALDEIRQLARQSNLEHLDLGPVYARYAGKLKLQPLDHEHLNPLGHRVVAQRLFQKLLSMRGQTTKVAVRRTCVPDGANP